MFERYIFSGYIGGDHLSEKCKTEQAARERINEISNNRGDGASGYFYLDLIKGIFFRKKYFADIIVV